MRPVLSRAGMAALVAAALLPPLAAAQEWGFRVGGTARAEFTDNYQLRAFNEESATTLSVAPFVTGYRRTENSQVNLLAGVGYNYVIGLDSGNSDYWSGRLQLDGARTFERSSYGFNIGIVRDTTLRTETQQTGTVFAANNIRTGISAGANYGYQLTERWSAGVFGSVFRNEYSQFAQSPGGALQDNDGYSVGGNLGYALTERTQLTWATSYTSYSSDITDNESVSTTLAVGHQFSQRLSASAYAGYFWSDIRATQNVLVCPTTPLLCQLGFVQFVPVAIGTERQGTGTLFGGSVSYQISERTAFSVSVAQNISPSGTGTITKSTPATASLTHSFTERLRGRLGASWIRSNVPGFETGTFQNTFWSVGGGFSYDLAQFWLIDVGLRHDNSDQRGLTSNGSTVFVQIAYNWPGQSINDWAGFGAFGLPAATPGAGTPPVLVPGQPMAPPAPVPRSAEERAAPAGDRTE